MSNFIDVLAPFAIKHGVEANVLPSLIIAQGILESASGTSSLATNANNLFGIKKGTNWTGEVYAVVTSEHSEQLAIDEPETGGWYTITAEFRKYPSYEGAVIDLCDKYVTMSRYQAVPGQKSFALAAQAVKDAGYATDPLYPQKLISIYDKYNLSQYDINADVIDIIEEIIEEETTMVKVAIDAGHGINTAGKRTPAGEREWTFNNKVALAMIAELNTYANVQILRVDDPTGKTDVALSTRAKKANDWGADIYVSIHHNANTGVWGTWTGAETYVMTGSSATSGSMKLAKLVHPKLVAAMGIKDRGIKAANFAVLRETKMPAILTEGGYMDSTIDIVKMRNNTAMTNQGKGLASGVVAYFGLKKKATTTKPATPKPPVASTELFRIRKTWADSATQKGAYSDKDAAIDIAKQNAGYKVFDSKGNQVYPSVAQVSNPVVTDKLFRVRKSWTDAGSQLGAFSDLDGAKDIADKNLTHKVFDGTGKMVYDPKTEADRIAKLKADAEAKAKEQAEAKAKAEAEAKAKAEAEAKNNADKAILSGILAEAEKAHNFVGLIVIHGESDLVSAYDLHKYTGYPVMLKSKAGQHKAKHIIVVGGKIDGFDKQADIVTLLSGGSATETAEAVATYLKQ